MEFFDFASYKLLKAYFWSIPTTGRIPIESFFCEYGNEHSSSVISEDFLTNWATGGLWRIHGVSHVMSDWVMLKNYEMGREEKKIKERKREWQLKDKRLKGAKEGKYGCKKWETRGSDKTWKLEECSERIDKKQTKNAWSVIT
jgi:hypothetical protein